MWFEVMLGGERERERNWCFWRAAWEAREGLERGGEKRPALRRRGAESGCDTSDISYIYMLIVSCTNRKLA